MPISKSYATADEAAAAIRQLKLAGFGDQHIKTDEDGHGATVVTVYAPFGHALAAEEVLGRQSAGSGGQAHQVSRRAEFGADDPAPLSAMLGLPTLSRNPAPLSSLFGWRTLSASQTPKAKLIDRAAPFSSALGLPVLSKRVTYMGYHKGKYDPAPLSSLLGLPLLLKNPAPLSSKLGWKLLSKEPAPLSHLLGMKTLSEDQ